MNICKATKPSRFNGRKLFPGDYFGYDDAGKPFIATRILMHGNNRFMQVWRLNPYRGWLLGWESNTTTIAVRRRMLQDNPRMHFSYELDITGAERNPMARVLNPSGTVVVA